MVSEKNVAEISQHEKIVKVSANRKWVCDQLKTALHDTLPGTKARSVPNISNLTCMVAKKNLTEIL